MTTDRAKTIRPGRYTMECECCQTRWKAQIKPDPVDAGCIVMELDETYCPKCVQQDCKIVETPDGRPWRTN
jgi:Zn finger protein HypA/HybF involved in hydrogenase expression